MRYFPSVYFRFVPVWLTLLASSVGVPSIPTAASCQLTVNNNGQDLPIDFDHDRGLDLSLIKGISLRKGGDLQISVSGGVRFCLVFEEDQFVKVYAYHSISTLFLGISLFTHSMYV